MGSLFQSFQQNKQRQQGLPLSHRPADSNVVKYTKHNRNSSSSNNEVQSESGPLSGGGGIRKRLSSLSLKMQMQLQPSSSAMMMMISSSSSSSYRWSSSWAGAFRRSKSTSSMGTADHHQYGGGGGDSIIRKWWEWGWGWILSRKPTFAKDLEMNEAESAALGRQSKGSWRHIFYKVKSELGKLVGSSDNAGLPQTIRYGSSSKNFDRVPLTTTQY
ncbi:uncharacterized protein LOC113782979 [Coffea eugenioides]|uniref:uncharacterized protein LOC113782979 n=1 Tax=Coffea eugenioides TaxID=49369 RepID=UPI000F607B6A|nr:uncharacterized protein LOC113782979 [Coffea eugenioides]